MPFAIQIQEANMCCLKFSGRTNCYVQFNFLLHVCCVVFTAVCLLFHFHDVF